MLKEGRKVGRKHVDGTAMLYVTDHIFLEVTLDRCLAWTLTIRRIKHELRSFIGVTQMICGTTWGPLDTALLRLYDALFVGLLRYCFPDFRGIFRSNLKILQSLPTQTLRACLGS